MSWIPTQEPFWQLSIVHASPSTQDVPFGWKPFTGQLALLPVQFSATSHWSAAARHSVVDGSKTSAGQLVPVPLHDSATSQMPADERQTVPALPAGCWQRTLLPSHWSSVQGF